ncbi:putative DNA helicase [Megavirus courdo11]|uniref:Putative DNA helicase n=2 Tax=Megavirus TaxID=3044761 RepID=K7YFI2_9VIRU|nr:putative DNA helicase [Megavirus courdo7]AFX92732.1 putative DNA helicase [Megavirus courdo11]AVL93965.1 putative DNA helicase [Megavirus vitis]
MFNTKQLAAINKISEFISQDDHKKFYLLGFAGSGKTYTMTQKVKDMLLKNEVSNVFFCAPTHKALNVLESQIQSTFNESDHKILHNRIRYMTLHKLLEFKPVIVAENGSKVFKSTKESKFLKNICNNLVIVDECSMICEEMVKELDKYVDLYPIKIIFMGDRKQLPPVGEPESLIFSLIPPNYYYHIVLDDIMRTNSDDIKNVCNLIRNMDTIDLNKGMVEIHNGSKNKSFRLYHQKKDHTKSSWFKSFIREFNNNETPIVLTWKNATCDKYNTMIRQFVHKSISLEKYMPGDYLIFNNFYSSEENEGFYTSDMVKIIHVENIESILFDWSKIVLKDAKSVINQGFNDIVKKISKLHNNFKINILQIERVRSDVIDISQGLHKIKVIDVDDIIKYKNMLKIVKEHIEFFFKRYKCEKVVSMLWDYYHKKLIEPFAEVNFGFSITSHKSQGSTYNSVYVDIQDILSNPNTIESHKALYTAAGRAANRLGFII